MTDKEAKILDTDSGVYIATDIAGNMAEHGSFVPNTWNPNKMDDFMRDRLHKSIEEDGFIMPVLVRPNTQGTNEYWEIVDGEHRWRIAGEKGMKEVPFVNLGPISDEEAKAITIKANTLKGEFDSVELAKIIEELASEGGIAALSESLPYTPERLQGMVDLLNTDVGDIQMPEGLGETSDDDDDGDGSEKPKGTAESEFKSFDPTEATFRNQCPRCGFEFNDKKD